MLTLGCLIPLTWVATAESATFTVGAGGGCTHSSLEAALQSAADNGPGQDEIRIARDQPYTQVALDISTAVRLVGGYDSCTAGDPPPGQRTTLDGSGGSPDSVLTVDGNLVVAIEKLELTGGDPEPSDPTTGGGGLRIEGAAVLVVDCDIHGNTARNGGGIKVADGSLTMDESAVHHNVSTRYGGGLNCAGTTLVLTDGSLADNQAGAAGGGLHSLLCQITTRRFSFDRNSAEDAGGGIALRNASSLVASDLSSFDDNLSENSGGGLLIAEGSDATLEDSRILDNHAHQAGGGAALLTASQLTMRRTAACTQVQSCSELAGNRSDDFQRGGGGLALFGGSSAEVHGTLVAGNRASDSNGTPSAFHLAGDGSSLLVESSVITGQTTSEYVIRTQDASELTLAYSTVSGNSDHGAVIDAASASLVLIYGSIIWEGQGQVLSPTSSAFAADCLLAHELGSVTGATHAWVADPLFAGPGQGRFDLRVGSPAIDICDDALYAPTGGDVYGANRLWDAPKDNLLGAYDLGAAELQLFFGSGFESGGLGDW